MVRISSSYFVGVAAKVLGCWGPVYFIYNSKVTAINASVWYWCEKCSEKCLSYYYYFFFGIRRNYTSLEKILSTFITNFSCVHGSFWNFLITEKN